MSTFRAKDSLVQSRQLEAQEIVAQCDLVAGSSDAPSIISIDNSTIADTVITADLGEPIAKCFLAEVRNRATGAIVALEGAPSVSGSEISVQVDGTGQSNVCLVLKYKVQE